MKTPALTPRQQAFADHYLAGMPAAKAYTAAGYTRNRSAAAAEASRLLRKPALKAYLKQARARMDQAAEIERHEVIRYLAAIIRTPIGTLDASSPLVQEFTESELADGIISRRVKMPDKLKAVEILVRIMGWQESEKIEVAADDALTRLLVSIRSKSS